MRLLNAGLALLLAAGLCGADTITMKSGRVINGTYLGGTARTVRVDMGDRVETLDIADVARIEFGGPSASMPSGDRPPVLRRRDSSDTGSSGPVLQPADSGNTDSDRPVLRRAPNSDASPAPAPESSGILKPDAVAADAPHIAPIEIPAGTNFRIRMIDGVDSERNSVGQVFKASLDEPVKDANGDTLIPRGTDVLVKLVDAQQSGKFTGKTELALSLSSIKVNGRLLDVNTQTVRQESSSRGERTAKVTGGAAAVGAVIGAIAGGGKGAAVGAGAGAAAGAGSEVVTKGQTVKIPSETRLTFVLDNPLKI